MGIGVIHLLIFKMKLILKKVIEFFVTKIIAFYYNLEIAKNVIDIID